jgi:predicted dehydrogenase
MSRSLRVALIGVGHYHSTWYPAYLSILQRQNVSIVGIHDLSQSLAQDRAQRFGGAAYTDYRQMLEDTEPDFVVALGRHADMPPVFRYLVDLGVPFLMEKPWATDEPTLKELVVLAESRAAWVAAPFPMRYSYWAETARDMVQSGALGNVPHMVYRMIRPGVQRYIEQGCDWMLSKELAGGGVLINLGCHGFDLCNFITGEPAEVVSCVASHAVCGLEVEDYSLVTLRTKSGAIFHNEVGYTIPVEQGGDAERKVAGEKGMLWGTNTGLRILTPGRDETLEQPAGYVGGWERVVIECLDALARGDGPPIGPREAYEGLAPIFTAYQMAGE